MHASVQDRLFEHTLTASTDTPEDRALDAWRKHKIIASVKMRWRVGTTPCPSQALLPLAWQGPRRVRPPGPSLHPRLRQRLMPQRCPRRDPPYHPALPPRTRPRACDGLPAEPGTPLDLQRSAGVFIADAVAAPRVEGAPLAASTSLALGSNVFNTLGRGQVGATAQDTCAASQRCHSPRKHGGAVLLVRPLVHLGAHLLAGRVRTAGRGVASPYRRPGRQGRKNQRRHCLRVHRKRWQHHPNSFRRPRPPPPGRRRLPSASPGRRRNPFGIMSRSPWDPGPHSDDFGDDSDGEHNHNHGRST